MHRTKQVLQLAWRRLEGVANFAWQCGAIYLQVGRIADARGLLDRALTLTTALGDDRPAPG